LNIVILAAGMGKRMRSEIPKVLHPLAGTPLVGHVIEVARALGPSRLIVIYGHGGSLVPDAFAGQDDLHWVRQELQLGTGHAVAQTIPYLDDSDTTLVLSGDVPLTRQTTLERLMAAPIPRDTGASCAARAGSRGSSRRRMRHPSNAESPRSIVESWSPPPRRSSAGSDSSRTTTPRASTT